MGKTENYRRCKDFLFENGWKLGEAEGPTDTYDHFYRQGYLSIDLSPKKMVFIAGDGDFLHKDTDYYALIGVLLEFRQLPINYTSIAHE